jgi:hypothetical protein
MTIANSNPRADHDLADNDLTYSYSFRIFNEEDLLVVARKEDGTEHTFTYSTDYTVSGAGELSGGSITFNSDPYDSGYRYLTILRVTELLQETDIRNLGAFHPARHEDQFDKLVMIDQQQQDYIDRSIKLPVTTDNNPVIFDVNLPYDLIGQAEMTLATNASGDGFAVGPSVADIDAAIAAGVSAAADAVLAEEWASKTDGIVDATDYSAKAWAIGGTDVTDTASRGAAKEWAIETASTVDGTDYSAKEWAKGTQTRGAASGGSAKDWATYTGGTVDNAEYSAKYYAQQAATSAATIDTLGNDVLFKVFGDSPITLDSTNKGNFINCDCTGGNISITLPQISTLTTTSTFPLIIKKTDASANTVTINRAATDTIDGATSVTLSDQNAGYFLFADDTQSPDTWATALFGSAGGSGSFADNAFEITDNGDATKKLSFQVSGVTTGTTRTVTVVDADGTMVLEAATQTLTNKTLTAPVHSSYDDLAHIASPSSPSAGYLRVYAKNDNKLYSKTPAGLESVIGGGGAGSIVWNDGVANAALASQENSQEVYLFESALGQELYTIVKVPATYSAGSQINMKIGHYSPSSSNTILLSSVSTLIRAGTDAVSSTTNQRTSTNSALTNSVANQLRVATLDLTDSSGQVNSVAVSAGDILLVKLTRGTDTDTADIRFLPYATEVTFS